MALGMRLEKYSPDKKSPWDAFVLSSKNATFLHLRDYMDYHQSRYRDNSMMIYDKDELIALLPANLNVLSNDFVIESHGGLTYGGFLTDRKMTQSMMMRVFDALGCVNHMVYKPIPHIYHQSPAEEDLYALWKHGANLIRRDVSIVVTECHLDERKRRNIAKAERMAWGESQDYPGFWKILEWNLTEKHGLIPVHTCAEMQTLASRFPENIKLYTATLQNEIVAGCVVYITPTVAHVQYSASSEEGRRLGGMSYLTYQLIGKYRSGVYFDFGISTEQQGKVLNEGLVAFKEGYGGHTVVYDQYEIKL